MTIDSRNEIRVILRVNSSASSSGVRCVHRLSSITSGDGTRKAGMRK